MTKPSNVKTYTNTPAPQLIQKIGATNLTLADAIAEIVANSFDSAVEGSAASIFVTVSHDEVLVVDNGVGMTEDVLAEAVKLGVDMGQVIDKKSSAKGKFGLGMKTACASMGNWWAIHTRPLGERREYRVEFDLREWVSRPNSPEAWSINIETWEPDVRGPLKDREHGTAIIVRELRTKDPMSGPVLKKLGESFKPHLEQGDVVEVNGTPAVPHKYQFVPNSVVPIDIAFGADGHRITGWVGIDSQTHNDGQYGFNIYRHNQLVQTWNQDWFAGHLMTSRIIGNVHMDFIDATFFKQGLQQSAPLWQAASSAMKEFMRPIVAASRDLSRRGHINVAQKRAEIIEKMYDDLGMEKPSDSNGDDPVTGDAPTPRSGRAGRANDFLKLRVEAEEVTLQTGVRISLSITERGMGQNEPPFDFIDDDNDPVNLLTLLNTDHPLFTESSDSQLLRRLAIGDSLLRYLITRAALEPRRATEIRNAWLLKVAGAKKNE